MTQTPTKEPKTDIHPFDKAGYGPAPYYQRGMFEDTSLGFCCDACGKTGLRYKFQLLSSTDQLFGVGSECIKKADPEMWLEMKSHYGSRQNITTKAVERREAYDTANALFNEYKRLNPRSGYLAEYKCGLPFDEVKRCQTATFQKEQELIAERIRLEQKIIDRRRAEERDLLDLMKRVGALYIQNLTSANPINLGERLRRLAHHCAENSNVTDYVRINRMDLKDLHRYLTRG